MKAYLGITVPNKHFTLTFFSNNGVMREANRKPVSMLALHVLTKSKSI